MDRGPWEESFRGVVAVCLWQTGGSAPSCCVLIRGVLTPLTLRALSLRSRVQRPKRVVVTRPSSFAKASEDRRIGSALAVASDKGKGKVKSKGGEVLLPGPPRAAFTD